LLLFGLSCHLDSLLDDIVAVLVCQVAAEGICLHDLVDHLGANVLIGALKALLDHIRREFLLAQIEELAQEFSANDCAHILIA